MTAMDNATKNALEMIDQFTLNLNRTRQPRLLRLRLFGGAAGLNKKPAQG